MKPKPGRCWCSLQLPICTKLQVESHKPCIESVPVRIKWSKPSSRLREIVLLGNHYLQRHNTHVSCTPHFKNALYEIKRTLLTPMKDTDDSEIILNITHLRTSNRESVTVIPLMILSSQVHHMTKILHLPQEVSRHNAQDAGMTQQEVKCIYTFSRRPLSWWAGVGTFSEWRTGSNREGK